MELRVLYSKAYKFMGPKELEEMAIQQFILGVRNNVMRERYILTVLKIYKKRSNTDAS